MRCRRCGRENPADAKRCKYCNTPFYGKYSNVNMPGQARKKSGGKTDNIIIALIIALGLIFVSLAGVCAYQYFVPKKASFGFGSGGGGLGGGTMPEEGGNENTEVALDLYDPDVEIYSFNTDTYDILVGTAKEVKFTAEIFANIELSDTDVSVVNETGNNVGYMNDKGVDGDETAGDGIYTLKTEVSLNTVKNVMYYAKAKGTISEGINICFYKEFTNEDMETYASVVASINEAVAEYIDENGYLIDEKYSEARSALTGKLNELKMAGIVAKYTEEEHSFFIRLSNGYSFIYEFLTEGVDSGLGGGTIATYQPFKNTYSERSLNEQSDDATDGSARRISRKIRSFLFSNRTNYDLDNVTLENLKNISRYSVVIWHGHGGWGDCGSMLAIGEKCNGDTSIRYSADITAERIVTCVAAGREVYGITGGFVEKYVGDMSGSMLYLAACSSGKDMLGGNHRYKLADSFIKKGAVAVVGNSGIICTDYNTRMERDVFNGLLDGNSEYNYYNLSEALALAKEKNGNYCCESHRSEAMIFLRNNTVANNYRLSDSFGQVSGSVRNAETNESIKDALVRIYRDGAIVDSVRTDNNGYYNVKVPAGEYIVKVTKGHYKTAKISVAVNADTTAYNETLLMIDSGITTGYANGIITNAVSGEEVSDVSIKMRLSWNNRDGAVVHSTATNENGYYEISFTPGFYTIEYSKEGYITGYKNIIIGIVDFEAQNAAISPEMPDDGEFRIVLSWSNKPKDLDSHLTGPRVDGGRFHLYYKYANSNGGSQASDYYQLDLDNTDIVSKPNIPETTTIVTQLDGVYRYSVHDYTNEGHADSEAMSQSNATVNVYKGSVLVATYHMPTNVKGTIWTVFELSGNEITPINTISNGMADDAGKF